MSQTALQSNRQGGNKAFPGVHYDAVWGSTRDQSTVHFQQMSLTSVWEPTLRPLHPYSYRGGTGQGTESSRTGTFIKKDMGTPPDPAIPETGPPQSFSFPQVGRFSFTEANSELSVTYIHNNLNSHGAPWPNFCLTPALGSRREAMNSVLSAWAHQVFKALTAFLTPAPSPPQPTDSPSNLLMWWPSGLPFPVPLSHL